MATTASLPAGIPETHPAVAIVAVRKPLQIISVPTEAPGVGEVLVHVLWTSSTPLDLHKADGGLLVTPGKPTVQGGSLAGTVAALGPEDPTLPDRRQLQVGDKVFGFAHRSEREAGFQTYLTTSAYMLSKLPPNLTLSQAVAVPTNLITAFHAITNDLGLALPWPVPATGWSPPPSVADKPILVWGAASSVGFYALQVFRHWGYRNVTAVASAKHHAELTKLGAAACFDYHSPDVAEQILAAASPEGSAAAEPRIPFILDCIGSRDGSLRPLTKIAERGSKVAVMLPVIDVHASADVLPEYEMDMSRVLAGEWDEGVELIGTRTHNFLNNTFFRDYLQTEIVPTLLEQGVIQPNRLRIVEGKTLLERAQNALGLLRERAPSGEKLVWRVADEE
ncbi:chaperonin 10-like protein [Podospora appendiculata]|uniref:Chaperonin 10-like protein n=1 Tax=Podospora appendiculata TaxID=314037 RepID=A0AAE0XIE6_9PEZI|nr:chaperonin 10-like protein [Podospora appendiculata]